MDNLKSGQESAMILKQVNQSDGILKPDFGVLATLQDDLLHFLNEMKFLMLFYDKPVAILTNVGFNCIPEDAIDIVRKGKTPRLNAFGYGEKFSSIKNL